LLLFHIVKYHLHRCDSKLVRTQEHQWDFHINDQFLSCLTSVVLCIVDHDHCVTSPVNILTIQELNHLDNEPSKRVTVSFAEVHSVEDFTSARQTTDKIDPF
jgi:hypothetical protein